MLTWEETRLILTSGIAETYARNGEPFVVCRCGWPTKRPGGVCSVSPEGSRWADDPLVWVVSFERVA